MIKLPREIWKYILEIKTFDYQRNILPQHNHDGNNNGFNIGIIGPRGTNISS